jgi:hypothetical protein
LLAGWAGFPRRVGTFSKSVNFCPSPIELLGRHRGRKIVAF